MAKKNKSEIRSVDPLLASFSTTYNMLKKGFDNFSFMYTKGDHPIIGMFDHKEGSKLGKKLEKSAPLVNFNKINLKDEFPLLNYLMEYSQADIKSIMVDFRNEVVVLTTERSIFTYERKSELIKSSVTKETQTWEMQYYSGSLFELHRDFLFLE